MDMNEYIYYFGGEQYFRSNMPFRALLYGEGLFETFRCMDYQLPVYYDRHLKRLRSGCAGLLIPLPETDRISEFIRESLKESMIRDAYVKLCILSNGGTTYTSKSQSYSILLIIKVYPPIKHAFNIDIADYRRNSGSLICRFKSLNYLENIMLKRKIENYGYDEVIILNEKDYVTECITHNIFWVTDNNVQTPSVETGILPGIIRSVLIDTLGSMGISVREGMYEINSLSSSSTVFLTNSISGSVPVSSITGKSLDTDEKLFNIIKHKLLTNLKWI